MASLEGRIKELQNGHKKSIDDDQNMQVNSEELPSTKATQPAASDERFPEEIHYFATPHSTTLKHVLILIFYHMLPFTQVPFTIFCLELYWIYKWFGWVWVTAICAFLFALALVPPYYSKSIRRKARPMYETLAAYLPAAKYIVPKTPFPRNKAYIFAFHPHGRMFYAYAMFSQLDEIWREPIKLVQGDLFQAAAGAFFQVPLTRSWFYVLGAMPADKQLIVDKLRKKNHVAIAVGGLREVYLGTQDDADVLYLKNRRGFLQIAMDEKTGVVPVYAFNENQLFRHDSKAFLKFWENVNQYCKVGVPFMRGYFNLPMPYRKELLIAIGDPLFANEGESIAEFQKRYIQAVKQLFDRYVGLSPDPNHTLIIT
ncbi:hypothetical protein CY35_06G118600 [Sphagnum magellanicum]|nr:hypothetical protein CY35_06G118600 [Sphagnum magellanicum]